MKRWALSLMLMTGGGVWTLAHAAEVEVWVSSEDGQYSLTALERPVLEEASGEAAITVDLSKTCQSMIGMGASFEHATCYNLSRLAPEMREEVIEKLVDPVKGIGMNLIRVCIGTSDFVGEPYYSYDDMPEGQTDLDLAQFSIEKDREYVLPAIKIAQAKNPDLRFFASPWSPPGWMKTTGSMCGGKLKPEYYEVYARYLIKYVEAYAAEGVPLHALTLQNEPGMISKDYPTCLWNGEEQRDFIRTQFGPQLEASGLDPLVWCWDHNWNLLKFPRAVLSDPEAARYVDGTAFHFYEGKVEAQTELHNEYPEKHLYFTEGSAFRAWGAVKIIEILRHWARSYNAWVIMLDEDRKPNNGPHSASATCIELKKDLSVEYRFDYYMYGQFMKFIPRGAVRVESTPGDRSFANVAFKTGDGKVVLVAANAGKEPRDLSVACGGKMFKTSLGGRSVATFRWAAE